MGIYKYSARNKEAQHYGKAMPPGLDIRKRWGLVSSSSTLANSIKGNFMTLFDDNFTEGATEITIEWGWYGVRNQGGNAATWTMVMSLNYPQWVSNFLLSGALFSNPAGLQPTVTVQASQDGTNFYTIYSETLSAAIQRSNFDVGLNNTVLHSIRIIGNVVASVNGNEIRLLEVITNT